MPQQQLSRSRSFDPADDAHYSAPRLGTPQRGARPHRPLKRVTLAGVFIGQTDKAWKIKTADNAIHWMPKAHVNRIAQREFVIPEWLAQKEGLI